MKSPSTILRYHWLATVSLLRPFVLAAPLVGTAAWQWLWRDEPSMPHRAFALVAAALSVALCFWAARYCYRRQYATYNPHTGLALTQGIFIRAETHYATENLCAICCEENILLRLLGAARLTLYESEATHRTAPILYLRRADARTLCALLFPLQPCAEQAAPRDAHPHRDALLRILLGVNAFMVSVALVRYLLHGANVQLSKTDTLLRFRHGYFIRTETRIRIRCIRAYDRRTTPLARFLRHDPLYLTAGGYAMHGAPLCVCPHEGTCTLAAFLPRYFAPETPRVPTRTRSLFSFFAPVGSAFAILLIVVFLSNNTETSFLCAVFVLFLVCLFWARIACDGFHYEGITCSARGTSLCYLHRFTLHRLSYCAPLPPYRIHASPFAHAAQRSTFTFYPARGTRIRLHSVLLKTVSDLQTDLHGLHLVQSKFFW